MTSFEKSFSPFVFLLKFFGLEKLEINKRIFNFIPNLYFVLVLMISILVSWVDLELVFEANDNDTLQAFLLLIYAIDSFLFDVATVLFYADIPHRRNYFSRILKLLKQFDLIASGHGIDLNYKKLNHQAKKLLMSTSGLFAYILGANLLYHSQSIYESVEAVLAYMFYFIYIMELKLYAFLFWNVFIRLRNLHMKSQQFKSFSSAVPQDIFLLFNVLAKAVKTINEGFSWNFSLIFREYLNNLSDLNSNFQY